MKNEIVNDYEFYNWQNKKIKLSKLFGNKNDLILIHNMGKKCPYCTMWADGFQGVLKHLENRAGFVVISPDKIKIQKEFAKKRGWKFEMVYSTGPFTRDMGFETRKKEPLPGVSVFHKERDGKILRVAKAEFGPGDKYCIVWHFFDLLKGGSKNWQPKFSY